MKMLKKMVKINSQPFTLMNYVTFLFCFAKLNDLNYDMWKLLPRRLILRCTNPPLLCP